MKPDPQLIVVLIVAFPIVAVLLAVGVFVARQQTVIFIPMTASGSSQTLAEIMGALSAFGKNEETAEQETPKA